MIGLFNECFPPVMDGVSVTVSNLASQFHDKGEDVTVITPEIPGLDASSYPYSIMQYCSLPVPGRHPYRYGFPFLDYKFQKRFSSTPFDIFHAHSPFSSGDFALKMSRKMGIPLVATFHSKYRDDFERVIPNKPLVVREAASLHTPSLVTRGSNTAEFIRDGINGFLADNDISSFANRLRYLLERPVVISWAAKGASETLARSWKDVSGEVLDRYQHLMRRKQNKIAI